MELVAIGKDGASHFQLLQNALRHEAKRRVPEMVKIAQSRSAPGVNKTNHRMALGHLSVTERPIALPLTVRPGSFPWTLTPSTTVAALRC